MCFCERMVKQTGTVTQWKKVKPLTQAGRTGEGASEGHCIPVTLQSQGSEE